MCFASAAIVMASRHAAIVNTRERWRKIRELRETAMIYACGDSDDWVIAINRTRTCYMVSVVATSTATDAV
jgi:hypothetical protein